MDELRPYAKAVSLTSTPAFLLGAAFGLPVLAGVSLLCLAVSAVAFPAETRRAFAEGGKGLAVLALLAFTVAVLGLGAFVFVVGVGSATHWMVLTGAVVGLAGFRMTRAAVVAFLISKPEPPPTFRPPAPKLAPVPAPRVEVVRPPSPPPPAPPPKPRPRELVLWGGQRRRAEDIDQGFYMISSPPGRGKTSLERLFIKPVLAEVLDPDSHSVLICFDPKRELYAWIASRMPKERDSLVPLRLFCPSDQRTWTIDFTYDFYSSTNHDTFALAMSPENPKVAQPFFENAFRAVVAEAIGAIQRRMGYWDLRLLMNVLSYPGYLKALIRSDKYADFVKELLSSKSEETAQNVQMEITSKLSKWRKVAAHLSHVRKDRTLSLERFLEKRGVLVIQKDDDFREQHNATNAMLLQRIGQILMKLPPDPTGKRKVYIVIDEFPSLGYIKGLVEMFRELRSRGVVFLVIWQSWANMEHIWQEEAHSIQGTLQNFIILGSADPKDAEHAAKLIGKVRGYEAERGESTSDGTNASETDGVSDTTGWSYAKTRAAGTLEGRAARGFTVTAPGFTATDTLTVSGSKTTSHSASRGVNHTDTRSVTWRYFERDIKTPTEIMRSPFPSREGGFRGVGYCVGEPDVHDFVYESDYMERMGVFEKNEHIPDYMEWPSEKYQLLEGFTPGELERLGLDGVDPSDPEAYPTPGEADAEARGEAGEAAGRPAAAPLDEDDGDWDAPHPDTPTAEEDTSWLADFLDGE